MGQEQSAVTVSEADSVTVPGRKCYVTSKLDEFCDYDRLWEELKCGLRTDFAKDPNLKSGEVKEHNDTMFEVLKIYDGIKLKAPTGEDVIQKSRYILDKENGEIREENRDFLLDGLEDVRIVRILQDPLRLELRGHKLNKDHRYGPIPQLTLHSMLKLVCKQDKIDTYIARPSRLTGFSPDPRLLVVESQPLDDLIGFDDLVAGILSQYKTMAFFDLAKSETASVVSEHSEGLKHFFETRFTIDGSKLVERQLAKDPRDRQWKYLVEHAGLKVPEPVVSADDAKKDESEKVHFFTGNLWDHEESNFMDHSVMVVIRGPPLVVECWCQSPWPHDLPSNDLGFRIALDVFRFAMVATLAGWTNVLVGRLSQPGA